MFLFINEYYTHNVDTMYEVTLIKLALNSVGVRTRLGLKMRDMKSAAYEYCKV